VSLAQYSAPNAPFVGPDGRLTFAGNAFLRQVWERLGGADSWSQGDLMQGQPVASGAEVAALGRAAEDQQLATEIAELRALVAELSKTDIEGQLAQLREQVAYMGLRRKRTVSSSIALGVGTASATYSISPALASLDLADLSFLGATATAGAGTSDAAVSVELTDASTITARRIGVVGTATAYFMLTEYTQ
jgi:hypothetical protein